MSNTVRQSDALEMLQSVAQRLAMSIDNARLFEQAQELAQQELEVNAISTTLQSVTTIDEIIQTTIGELSRALGANQASIRLGDIPGGSRNGGNGNNGKGTAQ
jgi:GAF domain-containing protein